MILDFSQLFGQPAVVLALLEQSLTQSLDGIVFAHHCVPQPDNLFPESLDVGLLLVKTAFELKLQVD